MSLSTTVATFGSLGAVAAEETPPAGGGDIGEIIIATLVSFAAVAAVAVVGLLHRRRGLLDPLVRQVEDRTGLPAWAVLPVGIVGASLLVAVWGYYWDVSWHIDRGRDPGAFANPAHWFIILGLDGIAFGALLAVILGDDRSPSAVRLTRNWSVPVGSLLLSACGVIALAGFPLDDIWHRLFGQDVTAWGPTHIQLIGGASLSTLACWALVVEGQRVAGDGLTRLGRAVTKVADVGFAGALLIGLSTLQVEFDFGVPQFRGVLHPILIALGAGVALVTVRIRLGRGGALAALAFFWVARGALTAGIVAFERSTQHIPLYVAEAIIVELVAARVGRDKQLTLGAVAGFLIGTVGFATAWAWSHVWMPEPWTGDLLPEAIVLTAVAGTAGGLLGGFIGRAVAPLGVAHEPTPRFAAGAAWVGAVGVIGLCLPMTESTDWQADLRLTPAGADENTGAPMADLVVVLDEEADAAADGAAWFETIAWQGAGEGGPGGFELRDMERIDQRTWRTESPIPVGGSYKTLLRLHAGTGMQAVPVFLPEDSALDAAEVPAVDGRRSFEREKSLLQREANTDNVNLERLAYLALAGLAAGWMLILSWGLRRLDPTPPRKAPPMGDTVPRGVQAA
ncbi:MAG: hypothetical protein Q8K58_11710 [Acidimicrobiales bacterium]|nr:hypothetical protein [Acidimicrobiales bacterium]